jgi:signal transduction histidine kinase/CheY-like chemotaxis protein
MNSTLELVSVQYALALLIGQDLDLRTMLRKFLPPALKLLNCRSGYIWLHNSKIPTCTEHTAPAPCYGYPALHGTLIQDQPLLANEIQRIASQGWQINKPGEIHALAGVPHHFMPLGNNGLLVLVRDPPLPESYLLALGLVLKRLETACLACQQHAQLEEARAEALKAKATAEKASKAKSEFLAMISHEIRTPMNGIIGLTDLMLYSETSQTQREYLGMIKSSSNALLGIINEILDFSRIEAGTFQLSFSPFALRALLQDTLTPLRMRALEKQLEFQWEVSPNVPDLISGDAGRLRQIIINLVGNAIKFTEHGFIQITISEQSGAPTGKVQLLFAVRDTGIGISAEKQANIFQPFHQADNTISRRYGGTGLGLTISAQLIGMMGGHLQVESDLGQGSIFHFDLLLDVAKQATTQAAPETITTLQISTRPLHILLAEDNPVNRMLAVRLLSKAGHQVTAVENGRAAVQAWETTPPDVILMDVQMPEMDGLEATHMIRTAEQQRQLPRTPIIALTANAMESDKTQCLQIGMDDFLSKPFKAQELLEVLQHTCLTTATP